ncbi:MAG TPA: ATP-grasp domain-containing protein [bacterium]|nr:ATP-grasp domain-containing protein [bacterium]HOY43537.1 ATP-grasp domain-containing protein [bacterium]
MKIALIHSSKNGMAEMVSRQFVEEIAEEDEEPPPDLLAECDSDETISAVQRALAERHEVVLIESDEFAFHHLQESRPDLVFNMAERLSGPNRESQIPTLCEYLNIPYTGSDPLTLGICLDKSRAKEILSYYQIPNPHFWIFDCEDAVPDGLPLPLMVKPLHEGSSKGIKDNSLVRTSAELRERVGEVSRHYRQPVIVERFLPGREFTVGFIGNNPGLEILPVVEIDHAQLPRGAAPIYSYEAKWIWDTTDKPLAIFKCPADISAELQAGIEDLVRKVVKVLRLKDWGRIDIRLDEKDEPQIIEVNPLPGILPNPDDNSCLPKAARAAGYSYNQLILRVVEEAAVRNGLAS